MTLLAPPPDIEQRQLPDIGLMAGQWVVAQVRGHLERWIADRFDEAGIGYYLPLTSRIFRDDAGKLRCQVRPVFPNYLFVCCHAGDDTRKITDRHTSGGQRIVQGIIEVKNQARFVRELQDIRTAEATGTLEPIRGPVVGQKCEITGGPFRGQRGVVVFIGKRRQYVIQITTLGRSVGVDIDPDLLEIIDDPN